MDITVEWFKFQEIDIFVDGPRAVRGTQDIPSWKLSGPLVLWRWEFDEYSLQHIDGAPLVAVKQRMLDCGDSSVADAASTGWAKPLKNHDPTEHFLPRAKSKTMVFLYFFLSTIHWSVMFGDQII